MTGHKTHIANTVASGVLIFTFIMLAVTLWLLLFDANPPLEAELPMATNAVVYEGEDPIGVTLTACRYTDAETTLYPTYIDVDTGGLYNLAPEEASIFPEGCGTQTIWGVVPDHIPPGNYILRVRVDYHVNALADRHIELYTTEFEVK